MGKSEINVQNIGDKQITMMKITKETLVTPTTSTELTGSSYYSNGKQSLPGVRQQFQEEVSEMLDRQNLFPLINEKIVNSRLMKILNFDIKNPLTQEDRRMIAKNMKCSLCDCVPPPMPKLCCFGHWLCNSCAGKIPTCPYETLGGDNEANCNQTVTLKWDITIYTKIYNKLKVSCKNCQFGCPAKIRAVHMKKHEKRCYFRQSQLKTLSTKTTIIRVVYDPNFSPVMYTGLETTPLILHLSDKRVTLSAYQKSSNVFLWLSYTSNKEIGKYFYTLEILDLHEKHNQDAEYSDRKLCFPNLPVHQTQAQVDKTIKEKSCVILTRTTLGPMAGKLKNTSIENFFLVKVFNALTC